MSEYKFDIGDRVKIKNGSNRQDVGEVGIVQDRCYAPFVEWDNGREISVIEDDLELIEDDLSNLPDPKPGDRVVLLHDVLFLVNSSKFKKGKTGKVLEVKNIDGDFSIANVSLDDSGVRQWLSCGYMAVIERGYTMGEQPEDDPINHPKHYNDHPSGVECIQVTEHMGFCLGNAVKYIWRADLKGDAVEDLKKARWYIERELEKRNQNE